MSARWFSTSYPGVRYYKHATRKHGVKLDQYFAIRYQANKERHEEALGWASEGWTAEKAYEERASLKKAARTGVGARTLKEKREQKEHDAREAEKKKNQEITVTQLVAKYIKRHAKRKKTSWKEDKRALEFDLIPVLGDKLAKDITRKIASDFLEGIVDRGAPVQACNVLEKCRKMFGLAVKWGDIEYNPFAGQERPAARPERERVLNDKEIKDLWKALEPGNAGIAASQELRRALKLILVTIQRPGEVIAMHRREIDGRWWTIPKERAKNKRPHRVYLTDTALELIGTGDGYIFPSPTGDGPIHANALALNLRRNILGASPGKRVKGLEGRKKHQAKKKIEAPPPINRVGVDHFVPHDLRRTGYTRMASIKVPEEIRERVVNHSLGKLDRTYNQYDYDDPKAEALQKWEIFLLGVIADEQEMNKGGKSLSDR